MSTDSRSDGRHRCLQYLVHAPKAICLSGASFGRWAISVREYERPPDSRSRPGKQWLYLGGLVILLGRVVNAVLLGQGNPSAKTGEDDQRLWILAQLHRERDDR